MTTGSSDAAVLRAALASSPLPSALLTVSGVFTWVNAAFGELVRQDVPDLVGRQWADVTQSHEVADEWLGLMAVAGGTEPSCVSHAHFTRPDGAPVRRDVVVTRIGEGEARLLLVQAVSTLADASPDESAPAHDIVTLAMRAAMDALVLLGAVCDAQGATVDFRVLEVNDQALRLVGASREDMAGRLLTEILPVAPEERITWLAGIVESGEPVMLREA